MHDSPKWLQRTPLGAVSPPHQESHASYRSASVNEAEDWDALESELAGDGRAYRIPNRGHLGLRDPPNSLNVLEGSFGRHLLWEAVPRPVLWEGRERYRSLVGAASVGGLSEPASVTQSVPLLHIKSSEEVAYPAAGEVTENMGLLLGSPGERVREEAVER